MVLEYQVNRHSNACTHDWSESRLRLHGDGGLSLLITRSHAEDERSGPGSYRGRIGKARWDSVFTAISRMKRVEAGLLMPMPGIHDANLKAMRLVAAGKQRRAETMGWRLNWEVKGHRVSDFPHAIYKAGALGDFAASPTTGLWILEIQIAHPTRPIGAFYEDLLIRDGRVRVDGRPATDPLAAVVPERLMVHDLHATLMPELVELAMSTAGKALVASGDGAIARVVPNPCDRSDSRTVLSHPR